MSSNDINTDTLIKMNSNATLNTSSKLILKYWYSKCKIFYKCHKETSEYLDRVHKYMGVPAILVGVFNTTSTFSNYFAQIPYLTLINGAASFIATTLSGLQNYFDLSRLVNTHLKLANGYNKIVHMIEKILVYEKLNETRQVNSQFTDTIINQMEYLQQDAPNIPDFIWNKHKTDLKKMVSIIINNKDFVNEIASVDSMKNDKSAESKDSPVGDDKAIEIVFDNSKKST
jgi:hypothetical protein